MFTNEVHELDLFNPTPFFSDGMLKEETTVGFDFGDEGKVLLVDKFNELRRSVPGIKDDRAEADIF